MVNKGKIKFNAVAHLNDWKNNLKFVHCIHGCCSSQLLIYVGSNIRIIIKQSPPLATYQGITHSSSIAKVYFTKAYLCNAPRHKRLHAHPCCKSVSLCCCCHHRVAKPILTLNLYEFFLWNATNKHIMVIHYFIFGEKKTANGACAGGYSRQSPSSIPSTYAYWYNYLNVSMNSMRAY